MAVLQSHDWPGNIRQLRNNIERLMILAAGDPDKISRHRQRDFRLRGAEIVGDLRKRRQIHVDRKRAHGGERTENENDQEIGATGTGHGKCLGGGDKYQPGRSVSLIPDFAALNPGY